MIKRLVVTSGKKKIQGDFCVTQISHSNPETMVKVFMDSVCYMHTKANVEKYAYVGEVGHALLSFEHGEFCKEITVEAPDAHVIVIYKDLDNGRSIKHSNDQATD